MSVGRTVEAGVPQLTPSLEVPKGRRYLHVRLVGGKAFVDQLAEPDHLGGPNYLAFLHLDRQRFRSRPTPCKPPLKHTTHKRIHSTQADTQLRTRTHTPPAQPA
jgi:hypothetical protein